MDELGLSILSYVKKNKNYITGENLKKALKIKGEEKTELFFNTLQFLVEEGVLFCDEKKGYHLFENSLGFAFGEIEINKAGNGFVHTKDGYTIFIDKNDLNGSLDGDKVIVSEIDFGRKNDFRGKIDSIVKRNTGNILYVVSRIGDEVTLIPYDKNINVNVLINKNKLRQVVDGEVLLVTVGTEKKDDKYVGEIKEVVGHKNDAGIDLKLIYTKYEIPIDFSKEALREAETLPTEVLEEELKGRVDLRKEDIITIDCDTTKDRDDAVLVKKLENGNYKLYTSIAHISHYIHKDSSLYKEASIRSTSHYPNNTCNPMFPPKVSNGICSLNEGVDRLTRTCEMEFDLEGNLVDYKIYLSVINSKKAMSYSNVNKILDNEVVDGYERYREQLLLMKELSDILEEARNKRCCVDFNISDTVVVQDEDGKIKKISESSNGEAGRVIENFMLATGTTIASHYSWIPFIYRVHEEPNEDTVKRVIKILNLSGFQIPKYKHIDEKALKNILERLENSEEAKLVRSILLRTMKRARYDVNNIGHFALQLSCYCHFTSPIRRFPDFRIHTLLDELDKMEYNMESFRRLEAELIEVAKYASSIEKKAQDIEKEALMMAMAEYMEEHIGEEFKGIVTETYSHGMFVKTCNMISGKVCFDDMLDDDYYYDKEKKAVIGKKTKKKYQIGNTVYVIVKDACKETRTINFEIGLGKRKILKKERNS